MFQYKWVSDEMHYPSPAGDERTYRLLTNENAILQTTQISSA